MRTNICFELGDKKTNSKDLIDAAKEVWKADGKLVKDLKTTELYYKPEEGKCYYVFNENIRGFFTV